MCNGREAKMYPRLKSRSVEFFFYFQIFSHSAKNQNLLTHFRPISVLLTHGLFKNISFDVQYHLSTL